MLNHIENRPPKDAVAAKPQNFARSKSVPQDIVETLKRLPNAATIIRTIGLKKLGRLGVRRAKLHRPVRK